MATNGCVNNTENFPLWALPLSLQSLVVEIHQETKAPISSIVSAVLATISLVSQGRIRIQKRKGLISPVSLWFIVAQGSGERKTTVMKILLKGVADFLTEQGKQYDKAIATYAAEMNAWAAEGRGIRDSICKKSAANKSTEAEQQRMQTHASQKPKKPKLFKLIHQRTTPQALIANLSECFPTTSIVSDEAGGILNSRATSDMFILTQAWDGSDITSDLVSEGTQIVRDPCLTLALFVQGEILEAFLNGKGDLARASGLLARCYVISPPETAGTRFIANSTHCAQEVIDQFHARCAEIIKGHTGASPHQLAEKIELHFSQEAQLRWEQEHDYIESLMAPGDFFFDFRDFGSKHADKIARLSALLHFFDDSEGPISLETLNSSIEISCWFANEFVRNFTPTPELPKEQVDANALEAWLAYHFRQTGQITIKKNDIRQFGPNPLRNKMCLNAAVTVLWQRSILYEAKYPGNKTTYIVLNHQHFAQYGGAVCQQGLIR